MDKDILEKYEPRLYQLFLHSRKKDRLANSYLLYGERNAPLKETALFLSESLGCESDFFACHNCPSCQRFESGTHPDFVLIDGEYQTIRKEDIKTLESKFSYSALEKGHRLTYVIHRIENITEEAANALLKFLEEAKEGQVAFLTSYNVDRVLPTILSRSLTVRVDPINPLEFYQSLLEEEFNVGKKKKMLSCQEAYILSRFVSNKKEAKHLVEDETGFLEGFSLAEAYLNDLASNTKLASYTLLSMTTQVKDGACYSWFYTTLYEVFTDVLLEDIDANNPFKDILPALKGKKNAISKGQKILKEALSMKQLNFNPTLTISRMLLAIHEEENNR